MRHYLPLLFLLVSVSLYAEVNLPGRESQIEDTNLTLLLPLDQITDSLIIGIYVPPTDAAVDTQKKADYEYERIAEGGFNFVWGAYWNNDDPNPYYHKEDQMIRILNAAEKHGIQYAPHLPYSVSNTQPYFDKEFFKNYVNKWKDYKAVSSFLFNDEIPSESVNAFGAVREYVDGLLAPQSKFCFNNIGLWGFEDETVFERAPEAYRKYLGTVVKPQVLSLTNYPLKLAGLQSPCVEAATLRTVYWNFGICTGLTRVYGNKMWGCLQSIGMRYGMNGYNGGAFSSSRVPTEADYRWVVYSDLVFGFRGVSYFAYCRIPDQDMLSWLINTDGTPSKYYYLAKDYNREFRRIGDMLTAFKHDGFMNHNDKYAQHILIPDSLFNSTYAQIKDIESEGRLFMGCFKKEGLKGVLILNEDLISNKGVSVDISLTAPTRLELWNGAGLEQKKNAQRLTLHLEPGEAKFLMLEQTGTGIKETAQLSKDIFTVLADGKEYKLKFDGELKRKISVYSSIGGLISEVETNGPTYNVPTINEGAYIIHVSEGTKSQSKRIIK